MIRSFRNRGTEDLFNGVNSKAARKVCAETAMRAGRKKLVALEAAKDLEDLKSPGYQLERLKNERAGQHAIRINDRYRVSAPRWRSPRTQDTLEVRGLRWFAYPLISRPRIRGRFWWRISWAPMG